MDLARPGHRPPLAGEAEEHLLPRADAPPAGEPHRRSLALTAEDPAAVRPRRGLTGRRQLAAEGVAHQTCCRAAPGLPRKPRGSRPKARSWPQAALTSSPRRRRTVTVMPRWIRRHRKASTCASEGGTIASPSTASGLMGMRLTLARKPASRLTRRSASAAASFQPRISRYTKVIFRPRSSG